MRAWNRTPAKAEPLGLQGARVCATPDEAVRGAAVIVTVLADADAVTSVMAAAAPGLAAGQVWVQASTVGVAGIELLGAQAGLHGLLLIDAPVLGARDSAESGELTVLAAGPAEARRIAAPVLGAIGQRALWLDRPGSASRLKLVVSTWMVALTTGAAEALALAQGLGVDPGLFLEAVAGGPLDCAYLHDKVPAILDRNFSPSFTVELAGRVARLVSEAATAVGIRLDAIAAAAKRFRRAAATGHGAEDMTATYFASFGGGARPPVTQPG